MNFQGVPDFWLVFSRYFIPIFALFNFILFNQKLQKALGKIYIILSVLLYIVAFLAAGTVVLEQQINDAKLESSIQDIRRGVNDIKEAKFFKLSDKKYTEMDTILFDYFEKVKKIPEIYSESQWKEIEQIIYTKMVKKIRDDFFYGPAGPRTGPEISKLRETLENSFSKKREEYILSKWGES